MKLTDNTRFLSLLLHELQKNIAPEVTSESAAASLQAMQAGLVELIKRETHTPALLVTVIEAGRSLGQKIALALAEPNSFNSEEFNPGAQQDFASLAEIYERLTARLTELCNRLSSSDLEGARASALLREAAAWEYSYWEGQQQAAQVSVNPQNDDKKLTAEKLQAYLKGVHPDGAAITVNDFSPIPGGFGKETYFFSLTDGQGQTENLIVRKTSPHPLLNQQAFLIDHEAALLEAVTATDFPAPRPLWLAQSIPGVDGDFYVTNKLPGTVGGTFIMEQSSGEIPQSLLLDIAEHMAHLHNIDLEQFRAYIENFDSSEILEGTVSDCYRYQIRSWRNYISSREHVPSPLIVYMLDWLERNVPEDAQKPVLVHGDFNIHNVLQIDGRISGVLDWECANFGAPEQDLAYVWPHIEKHIDLQTFVGHYRKCGGRELNLDSFRYYQAFSMLRLAPGVAHALWCFQSGSSLDARNIIMEQVLSPQVMAMGLASTANTDG